MKKIKKLLFILTLGLVALFLTANTVSAATTASYVKSSVLETNVLDYGISHRIEAGNTKTSGSSSYLSQVINVLEVPSDATYKVTSWMNYTNNRWNLTTVKNLMTDFEKKNPGWRAIAAVNGDFFDISATGNFPRQTTGATASNGNFFKSRPHSSYYSIGFTNDGTETSFVAQIKPSRTSNMVLAVYDQDDNIIMEFPVEGRNEVPDNNKSSVYFGVFDGSQTCQPITIPADADATVYRVDKALVSLPNTASDYYGLGVVSALGEATLGDGQFAIMTKNPSIKEALAVGTKIRIQYEWTGAFANIGDIVSAGSAVVLDGDVPSNANSADGSRMSARHPRTAIGRKANGTIVMTVVDGRQEKIGRNGVYGDELGAIMKEYGCVEAYNLDGGGSSAMVVRIGDEFVLKNSPSDTVNGRSDGNAIIVAVKIPDFTYEVVSSTRNSVTLQFDFASYATLNADNLYVRCGTTDYKVENGVVTITRLQSNTMYPMALSYINSKGSSIRTASSFNILCPPTEAKINSFKVEYGDSYVFKLDFTDRDSTTNLADAKIVVNGKEYTLVNGTATVNKAEVGNYLYSVDLVYNRTIASVTSEVTIRNIHSKVIFAFEVLSSARSSILGSLNK